MRVVVTGATGNVGTSLVAALSADPAVSEIVGVARRLPEAVYPKTRWVAADVGRDDLQPVFSGADAVVHLAWLIQPSRDESVTWRTNVQGSRRVFAAVSAAGVPALVYASSLAVYSRGPKDESVDESWPTGGVPSSFYSRHKVQVERDLDAFERDAPHVRVVRLRPALIFKREAGSGVRRLFAGPFLPSPMLRRSRIPVIPTHPRLVLQAVHSDDVAEAYRLAVTGTARGAFNVAAEPPLTAAHLARLLDARTVRVSPRIIRAVAWVTWQLRLQPSPPGWVDSAFAVPLLDSARARRELGWEPRRDAGEAFLELLDGMREGAGVATPPLAPSAGALGRLRELRTGVGAR